MHPTIKADLYRRYGKTDRLTFFRCLREPGFRYLYIFRVVNLYSKWSLIGFLFRRLMSHYTVKYGFELFAGTRIGAGFYLGHFGMVAIDHRAVIGENVNVAHGVSIGPIMRGAKKGVPTIGNRVWIGKNAVVLGNIKVGDNVLIAPLSYVNFDVPANSIVIGNPAKIIPNDHATEGYIENIYMPVCNT